MLVNKNKICLNIAPEPVKSSVLEQPLAGEEKSLFV